MRKMASLKKQVSLVLFHIDYVFLVPSYTRHLHPYPHCSHTLIVDLTSYNICLRLYTNNNNIPNVISQVGSEEDKIYADFTTTL